MYSINDFDVGFLLEKKIHISEKLHQGFCDFSGDNSPLHTDHSFAKKLNYKEPIGYAFLITALLSKIYGTIFPGGSELCLSQTCNFKDIYYVGDILSFRIKVIQKNVDLRLATLETKVTNQNQKIIFTGTSVMQLIKL